MNEIMVASEVDHKNIEDYEIIFDDVKRIYSKFRLFAARRL